MTHIFTATFYNPYNENETEIKYYTSDGKTFMGNRQTFSIKEMTNMYPARQCSFKLAGDKGSFPLALQRYNEWVYIKKLGIDAELEIVKTRIMSCGN